MTRAEWAQRVENSKALADQRLMTLRFMEPRARYGWGADWKNGDLVFTLCEFDQHGRIVRDDVRELARAVVESPIEGDGFSTLVPQRHQRPRCETCRRPLE